MALLAHEFTTNQYSLVLYHGNSDSSSSGIGTPHVFGMEKLNDQHEDEVNFRFTDFCFCQSNSYSLLSSLSVALLRSSGDIYTCTPILFRGTVVPTVTVEKTLDYIQAQLSSDQMKPNSPEWRQFRTAQRYLLDAFPIASTNNTQGKLQKGNSGFQTAQPYTAASEWPVQLQGPVLINLNQTPEQAGPALSVEPMAAGNDLVGLAIAHTKEVIHFGIFSPTTLIPRFQLESSEDGYYLDGQLRSGAMIQTIDLKDDDTDGDDDAYNSGRDMTEESNYALVLSRGSGGISTTPVPRTSLVRDPIMDTVIHYVTPDSVKGISTNTLKFMAQQISNTTRAASGESAAKKAMTRPRTSAWSSLQVASTTLGGPQSPSTSSSSMSLQGVMVSCDVQLGHVLVARLSNGRFRRDVQYIYSLFSSLHHSHLRILF